MSGRDEKQRAYSAAYRARHPERARAANRASARKRPELGRLRRQRRYAREVGAPGFHTVDEWMELVGRFGGRCSYCWEIPTRVTKDHDIPLTRGGADSIDNILPACSRCNSRKRTRTSVEFDAILLAEDLGAKPLRLVDPRLATLDLVTYPERPRLRTHCRSGHEYTPANTYVVADDGSRKCRECHRARMRARREREPGYAAAVQQRYRDRIRDEAAS